jgi:glycosyltransferase involved in cell wall biosynthesis
MATTSMKLLVVTPSRGESPWLAETVASVASFAGGCEHVLVAPVSATDALAAQFPKVRVVAETGGGMYAAINTGIEASRDWDAFTYINDDDILLSDFQKVMAVAAKFEKGHALVVYGGVRLINKTGRRLGSIPISPAGSWNRALYAQRLEPVYQHGTLVSRAAVDAIGKFDPTLRFCGDSEYLARACVSGVPFVRATTREVAAFRLRPGQLTKNRPAMMVERARVDEKLGLLDPPFGQSMRKARWHFRLANLPIYAERIVRHGFVSFDEMLEHSG